MGFKVNEAARVRPKNSSFCSLGFEPTTCKFNQKLRNDAAMKKQIQRIGRAPEISYKVRKTLLSDNQSPFKHTNGISGIQACGLLDP